MSLILRLGLLVSLLLAMMLAVLAVFQLHNASAQVRHELQAQSHHGIQVLQSLQPVLQQDALADTEWARALEAFHFHHLQVQVVPADWHFPPQTFDSLGWPQAPRWFVNFVHPPQLQLLYSQTLEDGSYLLVRADPRRLIEGLWHNMAVILGISLFTFVLLVSLLLVSLAYWFRPVKDIVSVLENVERGDFSRRLPLINLPELRSIAEKINRLTTVLGASQSENERLARKSLAIQEEERHHLAQELHDAMGQSISAIRAIAHSVEQGCREKDSAMADNAARISQISRDVYASVRDMMGRLRPSVLDELGLVPALQQMTDDWNEHHEDSFCRFRFDGDFANLTEDQQIHLFRIVQESLTNIAKHARAEQVSVSLSGDEVITLTISDDGVGFDPAQFEKGMGLSGIRERALILRGELQVEAAPGKGVHISLEFPRIMRDRRRKSP